MAPIGGFLRRLVGKTGPGGGVVGAKAWREQIRNSVVFQNLPEGKVAEIPGRMEAVEVKKGESVIREGDVGDAFYIVAAGTARVLRNAESDGEPIEVAQLVQGAGFGEEALISKRRRNASVEMVTDGLVMRLRKTDFDELLKARELYWLSTVDVVQKLKEGACLLDVRPTAEYETGYLAKSISLPLSELRSRAPDLDKTRFYICCCKNGRLSATAGFLLVQMGFEVGVIRGGMQRLKGFPG